MIIITKKEQILAIVRFAKVNRLLINPGNGFKPYLEKIMALQHCPCDADRPACPCDNCLDEVRKEGRCKCYLFWRDMETYIIKVIL